MKRITLANLADSTAQEVFDYVANHLLTQGKKSQNKEDGDLDAGCVYRNNEGLSCAAGCLMTDGEYKRIFEGNAWGYLVCSNQVPNKHVSLISQLQIIHDQWEPENWKERLTKLAVCENLSTEAIS